LGDDGHGGGELGDEVAGGEGEDEAEAELGEELNEADSGVAGAAFAAEEEP